MSDSIVINHKPYHTIRQAADVVTYSPDYITRLAREQKILAVQLSRRWYVRLDSLQAYAEVQQQEQEIRKKQLREQRRTERLSKQQKTIMSPAVRTSKDTSTRSAVAAVSLLIVGLVFGFGITDKLEISSQIATVTLHEPTVATEANATPEPLQAKFVDGPQPVVVESGRTVLRPDNEQQWAYIQYE